ncbi:MAG: hypothetical protein NZ739_10905 [Verrucomicrobiae bacterium]|nr:hypothetical protein [Verrucomicrobiae bacterium]MDW7979171.1 hypothetical protein [Verrucomicrobiales bacterium]
MRFVHQAIPNPRLTPFISRFYNRPQFDPPGAHPANRTEAKDNNAAIKVRKSDKP